MLGLQKTQLPWQLASRGVLLLVPEADCVVSAELAQTGAGGEDSDPTEVHSAAQAWPDVTSRLVANCLHTAPDLASGHGLVCKV